MKKGVILSAMLVGAASFAMLTGFDSAATAEDVLAKYTEASKNATDANAKVNLDADVTLNVPSMGGAFQITGGGTMDVAATMDPLAFSEAGTFNYSAVGQEGNIGVEMYGVTEDDGSVTMYIGADMDGEKQWQKQSIPAEDAQKLVEAAKNGNLDFGDLGINFDLASAPVDVNGTECYQLTTQLGWDDLKNVLNKSVEMAANLGSEEVTEEQLQEVMSQLDQIEPIGSLFKVNVELDVATDTYLPMGAKIDLVDSDWASLAALVGPMMGIENEDGTAADVELNVAALGMDFTYDYNTPVSVTVPDEAVNNAVEADPSELADVAGAAENAIG